MRQSLPARLPPPGTRQLWIFPDVLAPTVLPPDVGWRVMRAALLVLITLALAWGVWHVLGDDEAVPSFTEEEGPPDEGPDPRITASDERAYAPGTMPTTTRLTITVTSISGHVPHKARAGYVYGGREVLRAVNARGQVTINDAPLGMVEIVARAPGFERGSQRRYLNAGLASEVPMVLKLEKGFEPMDPPAKDR